MSKDIKKELPEIGVTVVVKLKNMDGTEYRQNMTFNGNHYVSEDHLPVFVRDILSWAYIDSPNLVESKINNPYQAEIDEENKFVSELRRELKICVLEKCFYSTVEGRRYTSVYALLELAKELSGSETGGSLSFFQDAFNEVLASEARDLK